MNLCEILKGHEGETFYSPAFGNIKLNCITNIIYFESIDGKVSFDIYPNGTYCSNGELIIFPSKDQRDWNKWVEEQKRKVPKTWDELCNNDKCTIYHLSEIDKMGWVQGIDNTPIEKSALALLKIRQLIEVGYGGNVTNEEWHTMKEIYQIDYEIHSNKIMISNSVCMRFFTPIAFHTKEQAEEFLSYPENVELLKDYFMI